jgi:hypothetical protein
MAQGVMILMRENTFRGPLEGMGPEKRNQAPCKKGIFYGNFMYKSFVAAV